MPIARSAIFVYKFTRFKYFVIIVRTATVCSLLIKQAALDQRLAEHEAEILNRPARVNFCDGKRLGLQHKLCRFLLKFAEDNENNNMSTYVLVSRGKKAKAEQAWANRICVCKSIKTTKLVQDRSSFAMLEEHGSSRSTRSSRLARLARQSRTCRVESSQVEFQPIHILWQ